MVGWDFALPAGDVFDRDVDEFAGLHRDHAAEAIAAGCVVGERPCSLAIARRHQGDA